MARQSRAVRGLKDKPTLDAVRNAVEEALGQKNTFARNAAIHLSRARMGFPLKEIASFYSLSPSAIGSIVGKTEKILAWNIVVQNILHHVENELIELNGRTPGAFPVDFAKFSRS
jgi:hypothetical protein